MKLTTPRLNIHQNAAELMQHSPLVYPMLYASSFNTLNKSGYTNVAKVESRTSSLVLSRCGNVTEQVTQTLNYLPYGEDWVDIQNFAETQYPRLGIYSFNGKEKDYESGYHYYGARYYWSEVLTGWLSVDPMMDKYPSMSPYNYCAWNPVILIDPDGNAWKPTINQNTGQYTGYEWIAPEQSYNSDGTLKSGLFEQAIFFSNNGTFDQKNRYNIGSSTATVYMPDGTTKQFKACTNPSDASKYATVPEGIYEAKPGIHNGSKSSYRALKLQGNIELGGTNPAHPDRTFAKGINIHKPGIDNLTGMCNDGTAISEGCLLIDREQWNDFINSFADDVTVSVTVSRSMAAPTNWNMPLINVPPLLNQICPADKTRVQLPLLISNYYIE